MTLKSFEDRIKIHATAVGITTAYIGFGEDDNLLVTDISNYPILRILPPDYKSFTQQFNHRVVEVYLTIRHYWDDLAINNTTSRVEGWDIINNLFDLFIAKLKKDSTIGVGDLTKVNLLGQGSSVSNDLAIEYTLKLNIPNC